MKLFKRIFVFLFFLTFTFLFIGCNEKEEAPTPVEPIYNITYDLDGGLFSSEVENTFKDASLYTLPTPVKDNAIFKGWYEVLEDEKLSTSEVSELTNHDYKLKANWFSTVGDVLEDKFLRVSKIYRGITYKVVGEEQLKLDIYMPAMEQGKTYPVLFFYFGGGWTSGSKNDISYISSVTNQLIKDGFIVVANNYRLVKATNDVHYPLPVEDCLDAIRYCIKYKEELHLDENNIGVTGYSAGGYMSLMAGFAQDYYEGAEELKEYKFKAKYVVDLFGPAIYSDEMIPKLSLAAKTMLRGFLNTIDLNTGFDEAFPSYYLSYNTPDVLIVHGMADSLVPVEQSYELEKRLKDLGLNVETIYVEGAEHTLGTAKGYDYTTPSNTKVFEMIYQYILKQK